MWCIDGCIHYLFLLREYVAAFVSLGQIPLSLLLLCREVEGMPFIVCSIGELDCTNKYERDTPSDATY